MSKEKKSNRLAGCLIALVIIIAAVACLFVLAVNFGSSSDGNKETVKAEQSANTSDSSIGEGKVLYDGDDMKVEFGSLVDGGPAGAAILSLTVENKTDKDVTANAEMGTLLVNDYSVDPLGGAQIPAGKKAVAQWTLSFKQANISSIDEIKSVSMNLQFITLGESVDVVAAAPISIEL